MWSTLLCLPDRGGYMRSFSSKKSTEWKKDFQRHHIIPVAVLNNPHFKYIFKLLDVTDLIRAISQVTASFFLAPNMQQ
jgi:hypothetical protein